MPTMESGAPHPVDLVGLFTSDDVRGAVPDPLSPQVAGALGAAFATVVVLPEAGDDETPAELEESSALGGAGALHDAALTEGEATATLPRPVVVLGWDGRSSGLELAEAFSLGLTTAGVDVLALGPCSSDELTYACGALEVPAVMISADGESADRNGITLRRGGAALVDRDTGLSRVRELAEQYLTYGLPGPATQLGQRTERDVLTDYATVLRDLVDLSGIRPLTVVVDAGHGMAGRTVPAVLGTSADLPGLALDVVPLFFDHDGSAPLHTWDYDADQRTDADADADADTDPDAGAGADSQVAAGLVDLQASVLAHGADLGLAFDADAGRCVVVDERGALVSPSAIMALIGLREVVREQGDGRPATIVHDVVTSAAVPDLMTAAGAQIVRTPVGRSAITSQMRAHGAVFGGEHDGGYYFRDFFYAQSGMLAALHVLATLGGQQHPLSALAEVYEPYVSSGEIRSTVSDSAAARDRVVDAYITRRGAGDVTVDELDGLTVSHWDDHPQWWFNLRTAGPVVRLTVEAADEDIMVKVRDDVLSLVRETQP